MAQRSHGSLGVIQRLSLPSNASFVDFHERSARPGSGMLKLSLKPVLGIEGMG